MPAVTYSLRAKSDLRAILIHTKRTWGALQAARYMAGVRSFCTLIASSPGIGRKVEGKLPGLRKIEHQSHVIYYKQTQAGILVLRLLHEAMLEENAVFSE